MIEEIPENTTIRLVVTIAESNEKERSKYSNASINNLVIWLGSFSPLRTKSAIGAMERA